MAIGNTMLVADLASPVRNHILDIYSLRFLENPESLRRTMQRNESLARPLSDLIWDIREMVNGFNIGSPTFVRGFEFGAIPLFSFTNDAGNSICLFAPTVTEHTGKPEIQQAFVSDGFNTALDEGSDVIYLYLVEHFSEEEQLELFQTILGFLRDIFSLPSDNLTSRVRQCVSDFERDFHQIISEARE